MSTITQTVQLQLANDSWANGGTLPSLVTPGSNTALAAESAQLSAEASAVVALSGGSSTLPADTYNAAGLLDSITAAGTLQGSLLSAGNGADAASVAGDSEAQQIVSDTLGGTSGGNGTQDLLSATLGGNAASTASLDNTWTTVLKQNPSLAGDAADNIVNGQIVNTIA
jgi:hypothetical protein